MPGNTTLQPATSRRSITGVVMLGLALTGFSMRTAVTSVGAALEDVQRGVHAGNGLAGVLTTLPSLCFAAIGALAPRLARGFGPHRMLVLAMAGMTAGLVGRALISSAWAFLLLSVLALTGGAISNVLLPTLVKRHFPDRIGRMTAVYTTALAIGTTAAAGLTVPIGSFASGDGEWRLGLGAWALPAALAILPWLPTVAHDDPVGGAPERAPRPQVWRSPTTWALTIFFAFQSLQAYIGFGWFAKFLHAHGIPSSTAGWMVALLSAITIPLSMVVPAVPMRHHRALVVVLTVCYIAAYAGLAVAPAQGAWLWMVLTGIGSTQFPLVLAMIGQHTRSHETTAAVSAFVQSIGYVVSGSGPLLFGVLYAATGSWALPLMLLFVAVAVDLVAGLLSARPRFVDDELTA